MTSRGFAILLVVLLAALPSSCRSQQPTPAQRQVITALKSDLDRIRADITAATAEDEAYEGGLIKSLIGVRLQVLKTNAALVEQRIHAIEAGIRPKVVITSANPDPQRAAQLATEIESQKRKVEEARREADRFSGGLVQAMSEASVATQRNTLALLEQQYLIAKFGLALPSSEGNTTVAGASSKGPTALGSSPASGIRATRSQASTAARRTDEASCLKIQDFDSSVLSSNDVYTELAWKVDIVNSCNEEFAIRVNFVIYDKDEFELDTDFERIGVPANGVGKARGKMLVSPVEKARRMVRQGASISR